MKIIHCADLHLDSKIDGIPQEKSKKRRDEIVHSFERLCEYATENNVSVVIIAGDMFDTQRITLKTKGRVTSAIKNSPNVDFLYLSGNHDEDGFIKSLEDVPQNLKYFDDEWKTFSYNGINICGVVMQENNAKFVYDRLILPLNEVNIVVMHGQVAGYKSEDKAEIISIPTLKGKNIDYLALGHIHSFSENAIDERGVFSYSGCIDGRGFDETGEKGFVLLNVEQGKIERQFVPFSSRVLTEYEFDVSSYDNWYRARTELLGKIQQDVLPSGLVKVVLKGEHTTDFEIDIDELTERLNEKFFFGKVYDKTALKVSVEDFSADKSVRGEFVRLVLESDLPQDQKDAIIKLGLSALKGEKI